MCHTVSDELQAAQARLRQIRERLRVGQSDGQASRPSATQDFAERPSAIPTLLTHLPTHLGWESESFTKTVRQNEISPAAPAWQLEISAAAASPPTPAIPKTVKVYPDIAIGLLHQEHVAAGRVWLLLQAVDWQGRGWLDEKVARKLFTQKREALHFCGARQLRNLLARGDGIFWARGNGRIWLRSVAKVAFALEIPRLKMRPVAVPLRVLTQKIGTVRAHLYATFHSSRSKTDQLSNPIARKTVAKLTQVRPRTQRRYERKAKVRRQQQFAIGASASTENLQARAWQQGCATFQFKDFKGKQGRAGGDYVAWQLPNSYVGPHVPQPKGCQKRINQTLTDLFMQGMTGNGRRDASVTRRFFGNGRLAAKAYLRNSTEDHYWRGAGNDRTQLWQVMEGNPTHIRSQISSFNRRER